MKLEILILATLTSSIIVSAGEEVEVGPVVFGVDLSAFENAKILNASNTFTDYDNYWFEENIATVIGGENKTMKLILREFANDVSPNNYLALYDMLQLDSSHYEVGITMTSPSILFGPNEAPAGVLIYSGPVYSSSYPENNSHAFLTYWPTNRNEIIFTASNLTCRELNSTINSIVRV